MEEAVHMTEVNRQVVDEEKGQVKEVPAQGDTVAMEFVRSNSPYAAGEIAGIALDHAVRLSSRGVAKPADEKSQRKLAAARRKRGLVEPPADKMVREGDPRGVTKG